MVGGEETIIRHSRVVVPCTQCSYKAVTLATLLLCMLLCFILLSQDICVLYADVLSKFFIRPLTLITFFLKTNSSYAQECYFLKFHSCNKPLSVYILNSDFLPEKCNQGKRSIPLIKRLPGFSEVYFEKINTR